MRSGEVPQCFTQICLENLQKWRWSTCLAQHVPMPDCPCGGKIPPYIQLDPLLFMPIVSCLPCTTVNSFVCVCGFKVRWGMEEGWQEEDIKLMGLCKVSITANPPHSPLQHPVLALRGGRGTDITAQLSRQQKKKVTHTEGQPW